MPLVRAWRRRLWGASGAALLVPGAVVAALILLALAGSFGQLGELGQALGGPAPPGATRATSTLGATGKRGPALLAAVRPFGAASSAGRPGAAGPTGGRTGNGGPGSSSGGSSGGASGSGSLGGSPPSGQQPSGCQTACPAPKQTLVDQVVALGTSVTDAIPGPIGRLASEVLKQVGATVDKLVPHAVRGASLAPVVPGASVAQLKLP